MIKGAYTYSHAIDTANYSDWTGFSWNADSVFYRNRASSNFNIPHTFQLGYVYELPFGKGKRWATSGVSAAILGDWQLNGLFAAYMGRQYTITASGSSLNMPGNLQTADLVKPEVAKLGMVGDDGTWFDTSAFARPTGARFGNVGRNTMRGPGVINTDLSLYRSFQLTERFGHAIPCGVVQFEQYAAFLEPERQRQQFELRKDPLNAVRGCVWSIPRVPLRLAFGLLRTRTHQPGAAAIYPRPAVFRSSWPRATWAARLSKKRLIIVLAVASINRCPTFAMVASTCTTPL